MSRWSDAFEKHPFQSDWKALLILLPELKIDDESILPSVEELARLRKVVTYIDGLLNSLDAELVPSVTWNNFQGQLSGCLQQIREYKLNRNIGHLQNANENADNLLTYVRPWVVGNPDDAVKSLRDALASYHASISEYSDSYRKSGRDLLAELISKKTSVIKIEEDVTSIKNSINAYKSELFESNGENKGIKDQVTEMVTQFENERREITQFYKEALVGEDGNDSFRDQVLNGVLQIQVEEEKAKRMNEAISKKKDDLTAVHIKVFGIRDSDDEKLRGGLETEINTKLQLIEKFYEDQNIKYAAQFEKIESLLPGAKSAGLAAAFHEMKVSFNNPIRYSTYTFYGSLFTIILISMYAMLESVNGFHFTFVQYDSLAKFAGTLGWKLPLIGVGVWLALFSSKRRSESLRLQQEYAHKETLAKSYDGFKKQIDDLKQDDQEMLKSLMSKAIESIADNASKTLDGKHGDKTPLQELVDTVVPSLGKIKDAVGGKT